MLPGRPSELKVRSTSTFPVAATLGVKPVTMEKNTASAPVRKTRPPTMSAPEESVGVPVFRTGVPFVIIELEIAVRQAHQLSLGFGLLA
jgi:hypothetical protein